MSIQKSLPVKDINEVGTLLGGKSRPPHLKNKKGVVNMCFLDNLELNIETHAQLKLIIERLKQMKRVDIVDDERRIEAQADVERFHTSFLKELDNSKNIRLKNLYTQYLEAYRRNNAKERYYESLDDKIRDELLRELERKEKEFTEKQNEIEKKMIRSGYDVKK